MPLFIEVNHVLGRRSLTLSPRDADAPVVVGRSRECDVQIPSVTVGTRHCMLFVHEGQWLLQESPNAVVTVNGTRVSGPVALNIGDVIGIGAEPKAPTIQIDPTAAAAGKTGPALESASIGGSAASPAASRPAATASSPSRVVRPPKPQPITGEAPPQLPKPRPRKPIAVVPLAPVPESAPVHESEPAPEPYPAEAEYADTGEVVMDDLAAPSDDAIDLGAAATSTASTYRRRHQPKSSGAGAMVALFVIVVGGLGALIWWAWNKHQENLAANQPTEVKPPAVIIVNTAPTTKPAVNDTASGLHNSIFDIPDAAKHHTGAPPAPAPSPAASDGGAADATTPPPPPPDQMPATSPADATDASADDSDPDWLQVLGAHSGPNQASAIARYDSYRQQNPDKHVKELAKFEGEAMEELWWERILQLFNRRAQLDKDIEKQKLDMTAQPADAFKKQMQADLDKMQEQRDSVDQSLTKDFGYTLPTPPDIDDKSAIAALDQQRDDNHFQEWKAHTLRYIREHNGTPPWSDE